MDHFPRGRNEAHLLDTDGGYDVLDAIVQANVDLNNVTLEELDQMVIQFSTTRRRKAVARLMGRQRTATSPRAGSPQPLTSTAFAQSAEQQTLR
jgi:hypothetical protein